MPTLLQVDNLSRAYGEKILFENISFVLNQYQKVALIARNGIGKTSLLNIIAGLEPADGGTVQLFNNATCAYLKQEPELSPSNTVFTEVYGTSNETLRTILSYEHAIAGSDKAAIQRSLSEMDAINGWEYEVRIKQILTRLKLPSLDQKISELSGGQKKRVALAKTLITEPDLLILDEPTNHLDVEMIEWLEEYLSGPHISVFMVTHDRYFLNRVCDEILEIEEGALYRYKGNYEYFLEKQAERRDNMTRDREKAANLLRKEQEWMRRMPKARTTKSKARIDSFYDLKERAAQSARDGEMNLTMEGNRMGKKILEMHDVSFDWAETRILKGFSYIFKRNEKVGIIGKNGSGKSTFLDILTGGLRPNKGRVEKGETVQFGYYRQEGIRFSETTRVIEVVKSIADNVRLSNGDTISAAAFLNYFMFPYPTHQQFVYKLSGGERRRLYLVTVLMQNPNFLILDEPTNDLDILTLNILEEYLSTFGGCVAVVTHDRYFLDKIVDHLFVFEGDGLVKDFPGNYTQHRDHASRLKKLSHKATVKEPEKKERPVNGPAKKLTYKEKVELETLETLIASLEDERIRLEERLSSGALSPDDLQQCSQRFGEVLKEIEARTDRWIELSEKNGS
jgi:ABC transport system ATP-binding/permease protein